MCPACITTVALVAAGVGSTGGLTAFVTRTLRGKRAAAPAAVETNPGSRDESFVARQAYNQGVSQ